MICWEPYNNHKFVDISLIIIDIFVGKWIDLIWGEEEKVVVFLLEWNCFNPLMVYEGNDLTKLTNIEIRYTNDNDYFKVCRWSSYVFMTAILGL